MWDCCIDSCRSADDELDRVQSRRGQFELPPSLRLEARSRVSGCELSGGRLEGALAEFASVSQRICHLHSPQQYLVAVDLVGSFLEMEK